MIPMARLLNVMDGSGALLYSGFRDSDSAQLVGLVGNQWYG